MLGQFGCGAMHDAVKIDRGERAVFQVVAFAASA